MSETVGFIGLGLMGEGFTRRLIDTGRRVVGYDIDPRRIEAAAGWGVEAAASPADVAAQADTVLVCVLNTAAVADVIVGDNGIATAAANGGGLEGKVLVDHSTTEIAVTLDLAAVLAERTGMAFVDAPVSGGPDAARAGTLAIMAGGALHAISRIDPLMTDLGTLTHMGPVSAGQATKLVNQTIVLTNYCVLAEALRLAEAHGVDTAKIPQALATGYAGSNLLPVAFERMVARDFVPRGYARQVLKDLEMVNEDARHHHVAMPMVAQALTLYRMMIAAGKADLDGTAIVEMLPEAKGGH